MNSTLPAVMNGATDDYDPPTPSRVQPAAGFSLADIQIMADTVCKSGLFPSVRTPQAACALMLICQSEGIHPMKALQRYHIIEGKPSKQANAMLDDFLKSGGRIKWGDRTDNAVTATFTHPLGGELTVTWDMEQAKRAGLAGKDNWRKYPRQMLTARVVSEGVRAVFPAAVSGLYTPEEVMDFDDRPAMLPPASQGPAETHPDNGSGHGRGEYASKEQEATYGKAMRAYVDKRNAEWADLWHDPNTGEPLDGIPELVNPWQANGHLVKWAVDAKLLDPRILPENLQARKRDSYAAVAYAKDRKAVAKELARYIDDLARVKTEGIYRDRPELNPDPDDAADFPVDAEPVDVADEDYRDDLISDTEGGRDG